MNNQDSVKLALGEQPTIKQPGVNMSSLLDELRISTNYVDQHTRDFPMLDNLIDAVPINREANTPFVGDTTLAGLVRSIPRNSLQQLPVFSAVVNGSEKSVTALLCTFLLKRYVFNEDTFGKGILSTLQIGAEQALTHGYAPFMVGTGEMYNDFGTTLRLLHHSDAALEPGVQDGNESGYHWVLSHPTRSRVERILRAAEKNPNTTWNTRALKKVLENAPQAKNYSIYESSARQNPAADAAGPTYEFATRYGVGPDSDIITVCRDYEEEPLRIMPNNSKWGYPRVIYLVIDPAALTPFGVSRVKLASPNQNMMNIYLGNIAAMLLLNSRPPVFKRGRFLKPIQLKQNAVWETLDTNADAKLMTIDNGALSQFTGFAQQFAGQIQNIMGGQTPTVQAATKDAYGNTGPGVREASKVQDISTNQVVKILENMLRQFALVALDTLFAEQDGTDMIIVNDETKEAINQVAPGTIGDDNKIELNWKETYHAIEELAVIIKVSLSKDELDEKKRADLQDMLVVLAQNAEGNPEAAVKVQEITNMLLQDKAPLIKPMSPAVPMAAPAPGFDDQMPASQEMGAAA